MPWCELRMWIEMLNQEFSDPEEIKKPDAGREVHDDISVLGITPRTIV